jgi:hypothetical protein
VLYAINQLLTKLDFELKKNSIDSSINNSPNFYIYILKEEDEEEKYRQTEKQTIFDVD